jgi:ankyrin repeat protein
MEKIYDVTKLIHVLLHLMTAYIKSMRRLVIFGSIICFSLTVRAGELHEAVKTGDITKIKMLLSNGEDINVNDEEGFTALYLAIGNNDNAIEIVELLVSEGADVNSRSGMNLVAPLAKAAKCENCFNIAKFLLENGADVNSVDNTGMTPLIQAARFAPKIAKLLVNKGADVNSKTTRYYEVIKTTPLHATAFSKDGRKTAELLVKKGAEIDAGDSDGDTPLHLAVYTNNKAVAALLISKGADVNKTNYKGWTPLHIAASNNFKEIAAMLIKKGADINARDDKDMTPLDRVNNRYGKGANLSPIEDPVTLNKLRKIEELDAKITKGLQLKDGLEAGRQESFILKDKLQIGRQELGYRPNTDNLMHSYKFLAKQCGLVVETFRPLPERRMGFYGESTMSVSLKGSYDKLGCFFQKILVEEPRITNISDLQILKSEEEKHTLKASFILSVFWFVE